MVPSVIASRVYSPCLHARFWTESGNTRRLAPICTGIEPGTPLCAQNRYRNQLGRFFFTPAEIPALINELKRVVPGQTNEIVVRAESICRHHFDLLGYEDLDYGAEIDWHLDAVHGRRAPLKPWFKVKYLDFDEVGDSKVIWELNRHQHLVTLAKAYRITGEEKFVREIFAQWTSWHQSNPYPMGVNWASSLEVAFRSLSWIWTYFFLLDSPLFTAELRRNWRDALSLQRASP